MHQRIKQFWDKYEGWAAPLAMVFFLVTGLQIGSRIGSTETQLLNAQTIRDQAELIISKDAIIRDKDARLRAMQDLQINGKDQLSELANKSLDAAQQAAKAAQEAAKAASQSADSAAKSSSSN